MPPDTDSENQQTIRFYDAEASTYDLSRYVSAGGQHVDAFHKRLISSVLFSRLPQSAKVLEMGCGTGRLIQHFLELKRDVSGMDASEKMLQIARNRVGDKAPLSLGSAYALPYAEHSFDSVYSILVLNLLKDYQSAFNEVSRVLKDGGYFLFNVPNLQSIYFPVGLYVNLRGKTTGKNAAGYRYSHWFTRSEIRTALAQSSFTLISVYGQGPLIHKGLFSRELPGEMPMSLISKSLYFLAQKN